MASKIENVKIGVCTVTYDGVDLGYTKGGVTVTVTTEKHTTTVDQFGNTPVGDTIMGRNVVAKIPLAETTMENMVRIMPGATYVQASGAKATGTVTFSTAAPVDGDKITVDGVAFTFKTAPSPSDAREMAIPATHLLAAATFAAAVNAVSYIDVGASVSAGVVTLTADDYGTDGNVTLSKTYTTAANCVVSGATLTGGADIVRAKVVVPHGVGTNLVSIAKRLVLRPKSKAEANDPSEDFTIFKAATAGGLEFLYSVDNERVFSTEFSGYPDADNGDALFAYGDTSATA